MQNTCMENYRVLDDVYLQPRGVPGAEVIRLMHPCT